jgi:hypothetical protein
MRVGVSERRRLKTEERRQHLPCDKRGGGGSDKQSRHSLSRHTNSAEQNGRSGEADARACGQALRQAPMACAGTVSGARTGWATRW